MPFWSPLVVYIAAHVSGLKRESAVAVTIIPTRIGVKYWLVSGAKISGVVPIVEPKAREHARHSTIPSPKFSLYFFVPTGKPVFAGYNRSGTVNMQPKWPKLEDKLLKSHKNN